MTSNDPVWPLFRRQVSPLKAAPTVTKLIPAVVGDAVPFGIQHENAIRLNVKRAQWTPTKWYWYVSYLKIHLKNQEANIIIMQETVPYHLKCLGWINYQVNSKVQSRPPVVNGVVNHPLDDVFHCWLLDCRRFFRSNNWGQGLFTACRNSWPCRKVTTKRSTPWMDASWYVPTLSSIVWQFEYISML